jgi:hypothetical protein
MQSSIGKHVKAELWVIFQMMDRIIYCWKYCNEGKLLLLIFTNFSEQRITGLQKPKNVFFFHQITRILSRIVTRNLMSYYIPHGKCGTAGQVRTPRCGCQGRALPKSDGGIFHNEMVLPSTPSTLILFRYSFFPWWCLPQLWSLGPRFRALG